MRIATQNRIKPTHTEQTLIPGELGKYLWEHKKTAPLEKIILRTLLYGNFEEIRKIYLLYPAETRETANRYPEIKRGVLFWIKRWNNAKSP